MTSPVELLWWAISPELGLVIIGLLALAIVTAVAVFGGGFR